MILIENVNLGKVKMRKKLSLCVIKLYMIVGLRLIW